MNFSRCSSLGIYLRHLKFPLRYNACTGCNWNRKELLKLDGNKFDLRVHFVSTLEVSNLRHTDGLLKKIWNKIPFFNTKNIKIKAAGYILFESIADKIDYFEFFEEFDLSDTFYSWFVVTELYIWMLSARVMADGDDGRLLRNSIVEALWSDVAQRVKKLGVTNSKGVEEKIRELSEQLQAALIAYDEGLQSDDIILAGAIWRRMYQMDSVHPEHLEKLVKYVRKQMATLDQKSFNELVIDKYVRWDPLIENRLNANLTLV